MTTPAPTPPPPHRAFLGWHRPLLRLLAERLLQNAESARKPGIIDLSHYIVVLPGARAGRRLTELLLHPDEPVAGDASARAHSTGLLPPRITTIQGLWNIVASAPASSLRLAAPLEQCLGWTAALRSVPHSILADLVPAPPAPDDLPGWLALAEFLAASHAELAANSIPFAHVPALAGAIIDFPDAARWHAAAQVERLYHAALDHAGLLDPAIHRERCLAGGMIQASSRVIIAGVTDMNRATRRLIDALGDACSIVIFAPGQFARRFDPHGCVLPDEWASAKIDIPDSQIHIVSGPSQQAAAALSVIAQWTGRPARSASQSVQPGGILGPLNPSHSMLTPDQITLGVPDAEVADRLFLLGSRTDDASDFLSDQSPPIPTLHLRSAAGTPIMRTAPLRLLAATTEFLQSRTFESFATLLRHPDIERWLLTQSGSSSSSSATETWLSILDAYQSQHLHWIVDGAWQTEDEPTRGILDTLYMHIQQLLGPLHSSGAGQRSVQHPLSYWAEPIWAFLVAIYTGAVSTPAAGTNNLQDSRALAACEILHETLGSVLALSSDLTQNLSCTAPDAIRILFSTVSRFAVPDEASQGCIELLGWLELPLDDAPLMVVTGMNEGIVPGPDGVDSLLPASLRQRLELSSPESRYARDAWSLSAILASRPSTSLICARRNSKGDPLSPSRLLLAADGATIAARIQRWASAVPQSVALSATDIPPMAPTTPIAAPVGFAHLPTPIHTAITSMSVTSFRDYIDSPYGFYLKHVARLRELEPRPLELDAMLFGTLLHEVLRKLQSANVAESTNPHDITEFLFASLAAVAHQTFGGDPMPAVFLQINQARDRLHAFAQWQANWAAQGWRIYKTEWSPDKHAARLDVDDAPMYLSGRIDRIDLNEHTGQVAILDYKSGDLAADVTKLRSRDGGWRDLQLPLYRHLICSLPFTNLSPETLRLGYIAIPRDPAKSGATLANWTAEDLESADLTAADIIRNIRLGNFSELGDSPPQQGILANICGTFYRSLDGPDADPTGDEPEDAA